MATPNEIARFRGQYTHNWDDLRQARLAKQKATGIVGPEQQLPPRLANTYDREKLSPQDRDRFDQIMTVDAADIAGMDRFVGRLVDSLRQQGVFDDTLILLMSGNGGNAEVTRAPYPQTFNGHGITAGQGRSFTPAFAGYALHRHAPLFWEHEGNRAIRDINWKLVARYHEAWELYDLIHNRSEQQNLAAQKPRSRARDGRALDRLGRRLRRRSMGPRLRPPLPPPPELGQLRNSAPAASKRQGPSRLKHRALSRPTGRRS